MPRANGVLVVVVMRTDLCLHKHLSKDEHWYIPAQNRSSEDTPYHPLGIAALHPAVQRLLPASFHLPVLANFLLLGTVPRRRGQVHASRHRRKLILRLLRLELRHRLDLQHCPHLHCPGIADESAEEGHCGFHSRILCDVSLPSRITRSLTNYVLVVPPPRSFASPSSKA
jgi:hypothetical protein